MKLVIIILLFISCYAKEEAKLPIDSEHKGLMEFIYKKYIKKNELNLSKYKEEFQKIETPFLAKEKYYKDLRTKHKNNPENLKQITLLEAKDKEFKTLKNKYEQAKRQYLLAENWIAYYKNYIAVLYYFEDEEKIDHYIAKFEHNIKEYTRLSKRPFPEIDLAYEDYLNNKDKK